MKILVTGGAGFIASHIVDTYLKEGHEVVIFDNLFSGRRENLNPKARFYEVDIGDPNIRDIFQEEKFDIVNHHAAQIDVRKSVADPIFDAKVNILGTLNILDNCVQSEVKKVIFASTGGALYGEPEYLPADEKHTIAPISPYAVAKISVEKYLGAYRANHGLNYTVLRYGNVYGPRQDPHGEAGVVAIFMGKMSQNEAATIFGDGEQLRDYVYVSDIAQANLLALQKGEGESFNIGTSYGGSVNEIFKILAQLLGYKKEAIYAPPRAGELEKIYLDNKKAFNSLGWKPSVSLDEGLAKTVAFFR